LKANQRINNQKTKIAQKAVEVSIAFFDSQVAILVIQLAPGSAEFHTAEARISR
jgi:hypothetical protein